MGTGVDNRHVAREYAQQHSHYLRKNVALADFAAGDIPFNAYLPAGAQIISCDVNITEAFNAGTTNVLTVGTDASRVNIVAAADVNEAATGYTRVTTGGSLTFASDALPYIKYAQTGTAATTGKAQIVLHYAPNNDG